MQKAKLCTFYSTWDLWTLAKEFHDNNFNIEMLSESLPKVENCGSSIRTPWGQLSDPKLHLH